MTITWVSDGSCGCGGHVGGAARARAPQQDQDLWVQSLLRLAGRPDDALAVAVHLPFCSLRCSYCVTDVRVTSDAAEIDAYVEALLCEMDRVVAWTGRDREVVQVHVGGGTPNLLTDAQLERLAAGLDERFRLLPETEWSIECDPRRSSAAQFDTLRRLGFRHLHLGMADLDADVQQASGRVQSVAIMADVMAMARQARFESVRVDLVCGLPMQNESRWRATLDGVLRLGVDRVRCLPYRHQPSKAWNQFAIAPDALPGAQRCEHLGAIAAETLTGAGYAWIGPDLFVLEDDPLARAAARGDLRRSALGLTATPAEHLLAFGAGQASDVLDTLAVNEPSRLAWQHQLRSGHWPLAAVHVRDPLERRRRMAVDHLQCTLELPRSLTAHGLEGAYVRLAACEAFGWVELLPDRIRVTPSGHLRLERLCSIVEQAGQRAGSPAEAMGQLH